MKVLHLVATSGGWGGLEAVVCAIAREQARQGLSARVAGNAELVARLPEGMGAAFDFSQSRWDPRLLVALRKFIAAEGITILHAHANKGAALAQILKRLVPGLRTVATIHNTKKRVKMFRGHDAVTAVSRMAARALEPLSAEVIRNGLPLPERARVPTDLPDKMAGRVLLGAYGRLVKAKGFDLLLRVLAELPEAELWLVGAGELEEELKALAETLGVGERVWFAGFRDDAPEVMRAVDLFVMPSRQEGFPLTLIEMLQREVPVVATRVAGAEEILAEEMTCPVEDFNGLLEIVRFALRDLTEWKTRQLGVFQLARSELTIERCAQDYCHLYARIQEVSNS
jgi:glycosyltransferase involved in cell wall biosynthesis